MHIFSLPSVPHAPPISFSLIWLTRQYFTRSKNHEGGTRWRSWLMLCATSRKVAGSIPAVLAKVWTRHLVNTKQQSNGHAATSSAGIYLFIIRFIHRQISGPDCQAVKGGWRLHNEEFREMQYTSITFWRRYIACKLISFIDLFNRQTYEN